MTKSTLIMAMGVLVLTGGWGAWYLLEKYSLGPAPQWVTAVISLLILCAATGLIAAMFARNGERWMKPFFIFLLVCAVASYCVVGITMVGGVGINGWNIGFWRVSAPGWIYAYTWFFGAFLFLSRLRSRGR